VTGGWLAHILVFGGMKCLINNIVSWLFAEKNTAF